MAVKKKAAVTKAAKRAAYNGKYQGPDQFKGDKTKIAAWKKAGSPKDVNKFLKTYKKPVTPAKKPTTPAAKPTTPAAKPTTPAAAQKPYTGNAPQAPAPQAPIIDATGKPVDPNQWQADQARLAAAEADNEAMAEIEGQEAQANLEEQGTVLTAQQRRDMRQAAAQRKRKEYAAVKPGEQARLNTTMAYRGMNRGSAYARKGASLAAEQNQVDSSITDEETGATKDYLSDVGNAAQRRTATLSALAPRKQLLALRGAKSGVYTK